MSAIAARKIHFTVFFFNFFFLLLPIPSLHFFLYAYFFSSFFLHTSPFLPELRLCGHFVVILYLAYCLSLFCQRCSVSRTLLFVSPAPPSRRRPLSLGTRCLAQGIPGARGHVARFVAAGSTRREEDRRPRSAARMAWRIDDGNRRVCRAIYLSRLAVSISLSLRLAALPVSDCFFPLPPRRPRSFIFRSLFPHVPLRARCSGRQ